MVTTVEAMDTNVEAADGRSASNSKSKSNRQPQIRAEWEDKKLLEAASLDPLVMLVLTGEDHAARCAAGSGAAALRNHGYFLDEYGQLQLDPLRGASAWAEAAQERAVSEGLRAELAAARAHGLALACTSKV